MIGANYLGQYWMDGVQEQAAVVAPPYVAPPNLGNLMFLNRRKKVKAN